ncbi:unnamed protein product [Hymenolepis diminuta]|uniref:Uncharacterized protein n=1 Tax=Hymenolepis diminuta TaxID=6216 RepID=A0A564YEI1_HYMDI|nr:unnamed protein product [Hymenolepis diminuta]
MAHRLDESLLWKYVEDENILGAEVMIIAGANVDSKIKEDDSTPLILAAKRTNLKMMKMLIRRGASLDALDANKKTTIHWACEKQHFDGVKLLLSHGSPSDLRDCCGYTPMMYAVAENQYDIVRYMLLKGVCMKYGLDGYEDTELTTASQTGDINMVRLLLKSLDSSIDRSFDLNTALSANIISDCKGDEVVKILLEYGADPNCIIAGLKQPIYLAITKEKSDVCDQLIKNRANLNISDEGGYTPLMTAVIYENKVVINQLISAGANILMVNTKTKESVINLAKRMRNQEIVDILNHAMSSRSS